MHARNTEADVKNRAKDKYFDMARLNDFRVLTHPNYSPVPIFPITAAGLTIVDNWHLYKSVKITPYLEHVIAGDFSAQWQERATRTPDGPTVFEKGRVRRVPVVEVTYAHASGCVYGDQPDVVIKSRQVVQAMDEYARERLRNINALLEAGVSYVLGPGLDAEFADKVEQGGCRAGPDSAIFSTSASDASSIDGSDSCAEDSAAATERLISEMARSETQALLRAEKKRLEECLATSSLAKGLYFKRCNGAWVSGVGDVLPFGKVWEETEKKREAEEGNTKPTARADKSVFTMSTTASTASTSNPCSTFSTPPASPGSSISTANSALDALNNPSPRSKASQQVGMRGIYGYALPPYDPDVSDCPIPNRGRVEGAEANNLVYLTSMLAAREELVRSGQVNPEDLVLTSWVYNRRIKESMKKREEAVKAEVLGGEQEKEKEVKMET
ncbi:hypothetical protein H2200_011618 [Cladophialophora chaetospira]|uniref:Uncharacterized protein n=1 Tax=Cladophialophora chaetospira TaxID=386627 RepID=A0AA38WZP3_9EURO|nr:hypothetical protein H2200_011618 [Cladophialophora chaetospira]